MKLLLFTTTTIYCIYNLTRHIDTDYCLLVQPDGFVINPDKWDDDWYNYDYIGAPWYEATDAYIDPWVSSIEWEWRILFP
jgi:hypothetical protein